MRVLVTGSGGFVGPHLVEHLRASGDDVIQWRGGDPSPDVQDRTALREALDGVAVDLVYHLAAQSRVDLSWDDPAATMAVNAVGTANLLQALDELESPARLLLMSSAEVYGSVAAEDLPVDESATPSPRTPYGVSKAAAEQLALLSGEARGREVIVCRPFNQIGPGQSDKFVASAFARQIVLNERAGTDVIQVGNLSATRDFLDVRDAVRAFRAAAVDGEPGSIYNVASGQEIEVRALLDALIERSFIDQRVEVDPERFRPNDLPRMVGCAAKLTAATSWSPRLTLTDTVDAILADWRDRLS